MRKAFAIAAGMTLALAIFAVQAISQPKPASAFERLKTLVGTWTGKSAQGVESTITIRLVSNGTAMEETFQNSADNQMVTLYYPDGNRVGVTHYCSAGNQPRMETKAMTGDQNEFDFAFDGITNLASPDAGHMHHLVVKIVDNDHFSEQWTWRENGKETVESFQLTRKS